MSLTTKAMWFLLSLALYAPRQSTFNNHYPLFVFSKEIEATTEWTLLGENDTVAAGMHIRMDLETGKKWVKLPDIEDDKDNKLTEEGMAASAKIATNGAVVLTSTPNVPTSSSSKQTAEKTDEKEEPQYDFDMMHRTLSQLPPEEKQRMELPAAVPPTTVTPEQRAKFEQKMKDIWKQRQEQLKQFEEEFAVDLPEVLKQRIARIQDYFHDPVTELLAIQMNEDNDSVMMGDQEDQVTHIVSVLQDLEFHLSDIDMTRDFYTLGGWPLLVSLLSTEVHDASSNRTIPDQLRPRVHAVQSTAAWTLGTAVKNTLEFGPYALSRVQMRTGQEKTALDILMDELEQMHRDAVLQAQNQKFQKYLYALGSILRGNRLAQVQFCSMRGPEQLGKIALEFVESVDTSKNHAKITMRLLTLAEDIVADVQLHESKSKQVDQAIVEAFASEAWCSALQRALQIPSIVQETALKAAERMTPYCQWDDSMGDNLEAIKSKWESSSSSTDPDIHRERIEFLENFMSRLQQQ